MSINNASTIFGSVSLVITTTLGQCDTYSMYWPPLQPGMGLMTSLLSPKNKGQQRINNLCFVIFDNLSAVQQHEAILKVMAAFIGSYGFHDIATTSYK